MKEVKYFIGDNVNSHYEINHNCDPKNTVAIVYRSHDDAMYFNLKSEILSHKIILHFNFPVLRDEYYIIVFESSQDMPKLIDFINDNSKTEQEAIEALKWMWSVE